jgi:hypothetical protein
LVVLGALTAIGAAGGLWHDYLPWAWLAHTAKELSPPLLIAGILGLTVDTFLKREFARDVFVAAFRYVLPDELKEEVRRIISYKFLCTQSTTIIRLTTIDNDLMRAHISHERTFKNITDHAESFAGKFAIDEWDFGQARSAIEECYLELEGTRTVALDNPDYAGKLDAIAKKQQTFPSHLVLQFESLARVTKFIVEIASCI